MKSLVRWGAILGLVSTTLLAPSIAKQMTAIALPEAEVMKRMEGIPLFAVTNQQGSPILATIPDPKDKAKKVQIATFFVNQVDATTLVNNLKKNKPDIGKIARVVPVSLRQAYEIARKNKDSKENVVFQFLPSQQQLDSAMAVLKQNGQKIQEFNGVPLFYASGGKEKGLLTLQEGQTKIIPFYFNKQDLQGMLDQLKKQNPQLSSTSKVEVTSLDQVVGSLLKENGPAISQITLVPARESLEFVIQQQSAAKPAAKPPAAAPKPATSPKSK